MNNERQSIFKLPRPSGPLAAALQACRTHFVSVAIFSALLNLLVLVPMLYMLQVYDRVVPTRGVATLALISVVLVFALGTMAVLDMVRTRLLVRASIRLDRYLSGLTLETSLLQRSGQAGGRQAIRELDVLRQALGGPALIALADLPWSPLFVLVCFLLHPLIGILVAFGGAALILVTVLNQRATTDRLKTAGDAAARIYNLQEEELIHANTVRALGMRKAIVARHLEERQSVLQLQSEAGFASGRYVSASKFIRMSLQSLALGLGAWLAIGDAISVGAIFTASFLAGRALQPVDQILASWSIITRGMTAYVNINAALDQGQEATSLPTALPDPKGRIGVDRLVIARPGTREMIISGVSFEVEPGEVLAIAGPSGAGKSTLIRAVAGAQQATAGEIRVDGAKHDSWDMERLAVFTGYVPQEPTLFAGTVKDNIARFQSGDVDSRVVAAAQQAGAHDMILKLPGGYDTPIQLGGGGLSAGQAQRIAIARALYGDPTMVLMDEPNAHLDAIGEAELVRTLSDLKARGAAVVVVAHRAGILAAVDRILLLREGRLEKIGPRDEVLAYLAPKKAPEPISIAARRSGQ